MTWKLLEKKGFLQSIACALVLLLAIVLCAHALAEQTGTCGENLTWTLDGNGTLTISGTGQMTEYPSGYSPFSDSSCSGILRKIIIEEGVASISPSAFSWCYLVTGVSLPDSLTQIGDYAFSSCYSLEEVALPDGITEIGKSSFSYQTKLFSSIGSSTARALGAQERSFRISGLPAAMQYITSDGETYLALLKIDADTQSIAVPEGVEAIGNNMYYSGAAETPEKLKSVSFPASLKRIEMGAFRDCSALKSISLPGSISRVGDYAFDNCPAILYAAIDSNTARALGKADYAFRPEGADYDLKYLWSNDKETPDGLSLLNVAKSVKSFAVPAQVDVIGSSAFEDCTKLTKITLPDRLRCIESSAFSGCSSLKKLILPDSLTKLGSYLFSGCTSLKKLNLPDNITDLAYGTFDGCDATRYSQIGSGTAVTLGKYGYAFCEKESGLHLRYLNGSKKKLALVGGISADAESVVIPDGVNVLKAELIDILQKTSPFYHCSKLRYAEIPASVNSISPEVFAGVSREFYIKCKRGSYAEKFARKYGFQYDNGKRKVIGSDISSVSEKVDWIVSNYITSNMSEREKARVLHDWIVYNCHYDYTYSIYNAEGALLLGRGVCDSQSKAYELLCTRAGLANRRFVGKANNGSGWEGHAWNLVRIDGQWYHVDVTWDNASITENQSESSPVSGIEDYLFFLISDEKIRSMGHDWSGSVSADNNQVGNYHSNGVDYVYTDCGTFELLASDHTASLVVGKKNVQEAVIPDTVSFQGSEYSVTEIRADAFMESKKLKKVSIGSRVKNIGNSAFASCSKLKTVTGGENLTEIGNKAFKDCKALTAITLESKVKSIGKQAFQGCKKLKNITLKTTKLKNNSIGSKAFDGIASRPTVKCPAKKLKAYRKLLPKKGMPKKAIYE